MLKFLLRFGSCVFLTKAPFQPYQVQYVNTTMIMYIKHIRRA